MVGVFVCEVNLKLPLLLVDKADTSTSQNKRR